MSIYLKDLFAHGRENLWSGMFMFETDYEDFIVDLFSELPTSTFFFKVANKLFVRCM
jgi:hypothetical protein